MMHSKWMLGAAVLLIGFATGCSKVPDLSGMTQDQAKQALDKKKLQLGTVTTASLPGRTAGTVIDQDPKADAKIPDNKTVSVVIQGDASAKGGTTTTNTNNDGNNGTNSNGNNANAGGQGPANANLIPVPDLSPMMQEEAEMRLNQLGLVPQGAVEMSDKPDGKIFFQDPPPATPVSLGTPVVFKVASNSSVDVPPATQMPQAVAEQKIRDAKLLPVIDPVIREGADPVGNVVEQSPMSGLKIIKGQPVHLLVKQEGATVPHLVDSSMEQAQLLLYNHNLIPVVHYVFSDFAHNGKVMGQDQPDNKLMAKGSPVRIDVGQSNRFQVGKYEVRAQTAIPLATQNMLTRKVLATSTVTNHRVP